MPTLDCIGGDSDATPAVQLAINACAEAGGGELELRKGPWRFGRAGSAYHCLVLRNGVRLRGEGRHATTLRLAPDQGESVRLIVTEAAADAGLSDVTLDGAADEQSIVPNLQRHGLFANGATRLRIERVSAQHFAGDGLCLYAGANGTIVRDVLSTANQRNGMTINGGLTGAAVVDSQMVGNCCQQFDGEPGTGNVVRGVTLENCVLDPAGCSSDYALAFGGPGSTERTEGWRVSKCTIKGPVMMAWVKDVVLSENDIANPTGSPGITVYRNSSGVRLLANKVALTKLDGTSESAIRVMATGVGNQPDVLISENEIETARADNFGVDLRGPIHATLVGNVLRGAGPSGVYSGIRVRPTVAVRSVVMVANRMVGFGAGITYIGGEPILYRQEYGNTLDDGATVAVTP